MDRNYVKEIIETIKDLEWKVLNVWVENNCIIAEIKNKYGKVREEGLYAGSESDYNDVYNVYSKLKYALNFNNMLEDNNVLI